MSATSSHDTPSSPIASPAVPASPSATSHPLSRFTETPDLAELTRSYAALEADLERAASESSAASGAAALAPWRDALERWEQMRRAWRSWRAATQLRYDRDTRDEPARVAQATLDRLAPAVTELDWRIKRRFLASPQRPALTAFLGAHVFALWERDVTAFDPAIAPDLVREAELGRAYTELLATAEIPFAGERLNLAGILRYARADDRETRHAAERARWRAFEERKAELDRIFDELVHLRHGIARRLGDETFVPLAYRRMQRTDYGPADVARYRDEISRAIVPLAGELVERRSRALGLDRAYLWDEAVLVGGGRATPGGDDRWIVERCAEALGAVHPKLGAFATMMAERGLLDVENRPGKAFGAYCTSFPTDGVPFVFACFNGTSADVKTLVHELGHAFQSYESREKPIIDYRVPTMESAEIDSMGLEYLSWPAMERLFGDDAERYRLEHLADAVLFLPYGVAVDHFQHLVYERPEASPAERDAMWQAMERRYLPWRAYGDLALPAAGGFWQEKRHIYRSPFYYIDYTLALCCALQLWARAESGDRDGAVASYLALCARGGEAPFRELVTSVGLTVPFDGPALTEFAALARRRLRLDEPTDSVAAAPG